MSDKCSDLDIRSVGDYDFHVSAPEDCKVCHDAEWGDVLIEGVCGKCLRDRIGELETALKCASACNYGAASLSRAIWNPASPFQMKINELVGEPPYGESEE